MSWSYSGNPALSTLDKVRWLVGDTDTTDQQLSNEEINAALADASDNPYAAAVICTRALISRYSRLVTKSVGDLSISYGDMAKNYRSLLGDLNQQATLQLCTPYAGGISVADKEIDEGDSDMVKPFFKRGMHDDTGTDTDSATE